MTQVKTEQKSIQVTSPAFAPGGQIPIRYTCNGPNVSPELRWEQVPRETRSLALIMDDPDAPGRTWVHWVLFNLPPGTTRLDEDLSKGPKLSNGALQGTNDFDKIGYKGPCPPSGSHRYFVRIYALDQKLDLTSTATKDDVMLAMKDHVLAQGELMGTYQHK